MSTYSDASDRQYARAAAMHDNRSDDADDEAPVLPERDWGEVDGEDRKYHGE